MSGFLFNAIDTWYFKEARPMDGFGGTELSSVFPPPVRTLLGALRTAAGDQNSVDWSKFPEHYPELAQQIGDHQSYGTLESDGIFIEHDGKQLYPLPLFIVHQNNETFAKMHIGDAVTCDLGKVRLPALPKADSEERFQTYEHTAWVDKENLLEVLHGKTPQKVYETKELFAFESRVGIARDNTTRTAKEGMLYFTKHIRPEHEVSIVCEVTGFEELLSDGIIKLGGEGRGAYYKTITCEKIPKPKKPSIPIEGIFITLVTPGIVDPVKPLEECNIVSACVGKSFREGGFDMKTQSSKPATSYLPAGSVWFIEASEDEAQQLIDKYHETKIGQEQQLGRGRILCGYWTKQTEVK